MLKVNQMEVRSKDTAVAFLIHMFFLNFLNFEIIKIILFSNFRLEKKLQKIIQSSYIPFSQIPLMLTSYITIVFLSVIRKF